MRLSVQFSCSVMSDPLQPHRLQHARPQLPCHPLPELAQTDVHPSGAIQPFHPLSSPSRPAFNLSQHQAKHLILLSHHRTLSWAPVLYSSFPFFNSESLQYSYTCLHLNKPGILNCCPVKGIIVGRIWRFLCFGTHAWLSLKGFICICFYIIKIEYLFDHLMNDWSGIKH